MPDNHTLPNSTPVSAGVLKRFSAMVYDSLLLLAISIAYGALALTIKVIVLGEVLQEGEKASLGPAGFVGWVLVLMAFYGLFWSKFGQTLGMRAWRLQVTDTEGKFPSFSRGLLRCLCACLSLATCGLGYFWLWFDKDRLTLHDRLSGTRVWQRPKEK
ncbi:RDD family protein [Gilvimarinus sp. SDUM040013]|uniref:RDD family protein n=1 Tax=Gilvimarinus gilvus TaxID=3058038 RepID=A0ABU4S0V7_9GAMM|nr:RDD family protein [Gilvimarinus sp. SDUM040013]MDO3386296.1 RDD family protein [Gilvimarinus sp. SDUM040013]MDX6850046.1 RDD family protein [Gilvimarinus sp. SDUM040013]